MKSAFIAICAGIGFVVLGAFPAFAGIGASVTGPIKEMTIGTGQNDVVASILVDGVRFHLTKETVIVFSDARKASVADLKVGRRVSAQTGNDIQKSLPPQTYTSVVIIQADRKSDGKKKDYVSVPILVAWSGQIEPELVKKAPSGPILSEAAWKELWQSWRKGQDTPYVDFENAIVLVAVNEDFNPLGMGTSVDADGDLQIVLKTGLRDGTLKTRFYLMAVVSRKGIKSIQGVSVEKT